MWEDRHPNQEQRYLQRTRIQVQHTSHTANPNRQVPKPSPRLNLRHNNATKTKQTKDSQSRPNKFTNQRLPLFQYKQPTHRRSQLNRSCRPLTVQRHNQVPKEAFTTRGPDTNSILTINRIRQPTSRYNNRYRHRQARATNKLK